MNQPARPINESLRRKRSARIAAIQGLYNRDVLNSTLPLEKHIEQLISQWRDSIAAKDEEWPSDDMPERAMLTDLLSGVCEHKKSIDESMATVIKDNWKPERMGAVMTAVLRCAIYELTHKTERKTAVIIDEYVSIASDFLDDNQLAYVNSAIHQLAESLRA